MGRRDIVVAVVTATGKQLGHPWFEASTPPIFGFHFPPEMENAALEDYCTWFSSWYTQQRRSVGMICDMSRSVIITPRQRAIWTEFEKRSQPDFKRVLRGVAIIATNGLMRGVVTAAYWMNRPVYDWHLVSTWEEGRTWLEPRVQL